MRKKLLFAMAAMSLCTMLSFAEPQRSTLTRENAYPELRAGELGLGYQYGDSEVLESDTYTLRGRYAFYDNFTAYAELPYLDLQPAFGGGGESGFGDLAVGIDLLIFEDIFEYPFVIPHGEVSFDTGDEEKGLGSGETVKTFGISIGTKTWDQLAWIVDASYAIDGGTATSKDSDVYYLSGALVWDVSDRFAVLAEARMWEKNRFDDNPTLIQGGMAYMLTENVQLAGYFGRFQEDTTIETDEDRAEFRVTWGF